MTFINYFLLISLLMTRKWRICPWIYAYFLNLMNFRFVALSLEASEPYLPFFHDSFSERGGAVWDWVLSLSFFCCCWGKCTDRLWHFYLTFQSDIHPLIISVSCTCIVLADMPYGLNWIINRIARQWWPLSLQKDVFYFPKKVIFALFCAS